MFGWKSDDSMRKKFIEEANACSRSAGGTVNVTERKEERRSSACGLFGGSAEAEGSVHIVARPLITSVHVVEH